MHNLCCKAFNFILYADNLVWKMYTNIELDVEIIKDRFVILYYHKMCVKTFLLTKFLLNGLLLVETTKLVLFYWKRSNLKWIIWLWVWHSIFVKFCTFQLLGSFWLRGQRNLGYFLSWDFFWMKSFLFKRKLSLPR